MVLILNTNLLMPQYEDKDPSEITMEEALILIEKEKNTI